MLARAGLLVLRAGRQDASSARRAAGFLRRALGERPDVPELHRLVALATWASGDFDGALQVLGGALERKFAARYGAVRSVLRDDAATIAAAWTAAKPGERSRALERMGAIGCAPLPLSTAPTPELPVPPPLRFSLQWDTDTSDVDLYVVDPKGEECSTWHRTTTSGAELAVDVAQGLGPEVAVVGRAAGGTWHVGVRYACSGPMATTRGSVTVFRADERGGPMIEVLPFVLYADGTEEPPVVHLGSVAVR